MAEAPVSGGATLYPTGGADPAPAAVAIDPKTGAAVPMTATGGTPTEPAKPAEPVAAADPPADPAKPAEPTEPKAEPKEGDPPAIDPASYEIKLAEGFTVDEPTLTEARQMFAELGVPKDGAQKLIDLYTKVAKTQADQFASAQATAFKETQDKWVQELNSLPEFQGDARERNLGFLGRLMDEFGSPEARAYFDTTGAGNNPAIVKMILGMGQALLEGEPTSVGSPGTLAGPKGTGSQTRRSGGQILYGTKTN